MHPLQVGAVEGALTTALPFIVFVLAIVNVITRLIAHRTHVSQANENGAEGIERHSLHTLTTLALVLVTFVYILVSLDTGIVLATFALTMFVADFFEFESRRVEARTDRPIGAPKAAIGASLFVIAYAGFVAISSLLG